MARRKCSCNVARECWNCGEPQFDNKDSAMLYKLLTDLNKATGELKVATELGFKQVITEIDDATNAIAATLEELKKKIADGGLSQATEDSVLATLQTSADKLKGIASPAPTPLTGTTN